MAMTRTRGQLRTEIMNRGDLRAVRHTSDEINRSINQSAIELWRLLVDTCPDYYCTSNTFVTVSGTATYSLGTIASNFYKILGADVLYNGKYYALKRFNFAERNRLQGSNVTPLDTRYRVIGSNLMLVPTPTWVNTIKIWFVQVPGEMDDDADTLDGIAGWEEYVILDVIIKARVKDRYPIEELAAQKMALVERIRSEAPDRDASEPDRVRDTVQEATVDYPGIGVD